MAETENLQATTDMEEVSSLPPSPDAKDRAPPSTPSSISTETSNGGEQPSQENKDTAPEIDEAPPASTEEVPNEERADDTAAENETNDDLPSDEEKEDLKNASFDEDGNEIPFDEVRQADSAESSGEAPAEEVAGGSEESATEPEETVEESPPTTSPLEPEEEDAQDNSNDTGETAVEKVVAQSDQGEPEADIVEETTEEEVVAPEDPVESAPQEDVKEAKPQHSLDGEAPSNLESDAPNDDAKENTEHPTERAEEKVTIENDEAETMSQKEEPAKEAEPEAVEDDAENNAENKVTEASGEEAATPNDKAENAQEEENVEQNESPPGPEPDTKDTKPLSVQVQFDVPSDDDQSDDNKEEETPSSALVTPRSGGISFAQAFSTSPIPPTMSPPIASASKSPRSTSNASSTSTRSYQDSSANTPTSHSALSASKNKKASGLISKYQEKVAHEALPGDSVPLRSASNKGNFLTDMSPGTQRALQQKSAQAFVELNSLPDMNSVRAKFEKSSRKSGSNFEFGESFRQKKRHEQLSGKQKEEEAKVAIRGFNEKILLNGKVAEGVIDTSNLPKSFTFDTANMAPLFPNDGICRVDYVNADFRAKVFVVHKTRGMLLLQDKHGTMYTSKSSGKKKKRRMNTVPGGEIKEEEFLAAATESGSPQVQLQIAAREAAARHVFETTGLDIRMQADRLKPAVLCMTPSMNAARGYEYLRNENEEKLYYFLQVDEEDFEKLKEAQGEDAASSNLTRPSEDPGEDPAPAKLKRPSQDAGDDPLTLKLSSDYGGYEFIQDPVKASKVLRKDGNDAAVALAMIMSAAAQEINGPTSSEESAVKEPDAKATEFSSKGMLDDEQDEEDENENDGAIRTIGIKEGEEGKPTEDAEDKSTEDAADKPTEDTEGKSSEDAAAKPTKSDEGKSFHDEEAKLHMKTSSDTTDEPIGVSCCCGFW